MSPHGTRDVLALVAGRPSGIRLTVSVVMKIKELVVPLSENA